MNIRHMLASAIVSLGVTVAGAGQASITTWDLSGVAFDDGGTASGDFTFNTATDSFVTWSITTTATTLPEVDNFFTLNGFTYTDGNTASNGNALSVNFHTTSDSNNLDLIFAGLLTGGQTTIVLSGSEGESGNTRLISSGEIVEVSNAPLPGTLPLFITALAALAGFRWMQLRRFPAFKP